MVVALAAQDQARQRHLSAVVVSAVIIVVRTKGGEVSLAETQPSGRGSDGEEMNVMFFRFYSLEKIEREEI